MERCENGDDDGDLAFYLKFETQFIVSLVEELGELFQ